MLEVHMAQAVGVQVSPRAPVGKLCYSYNMEKAIKFFGILSLVLLVLVGIAGTSDYWESIIPFREGGLVWSLVYFFSTIGAGVLIICFLILLIFVCLDKKHKKIQQK